MDKAETTAVRTSGSQIIERGRALALPPDECARQIRSAFGWKDGEHREVRVLGTGGISMAIVDSPEAAARAAQDLQYGAQIYLTMNPIDSGASILKDASPMLRRAGRGDSTTNADISRRSNFVIDLDPVRPTDTGATDEQLNAARELADKIEQELAALGWPMPARVDSGNGVHLYFRIDLESQSDLPRRALEGLAERFSTPAVKVDVTIHNPARILRVPGSWNSKGTDRALHRVARLVRAGDDRLLTAEQLESVATPSQTSAAPASSSTSAVVVSAAAKSFDLETWLTKHGVRHKGREDWTGGGAGAHRWILEVCAFNPAHDKGEAVITRQANGALGFKCHHDSCAERGWQDFRRVVEASRHAALQISNFRRAPYPVHALPALLRQAVDVQIHICGADPASVAVPLLTTCIATVGNAVTIAPWAGWSEAMAAWTALIAPSGSMKSSTIGLAENVVTALERQFPTPEEGERRERFRVTDATTESLAMLAAKNPRGLFCIRDELAGVLNGLDQYRKGSGSDEAFWLSAIDGKPHAVDRKISGSACIPRLLISLLGGIQPPVFGRIARNRSFAESGFAARFWLIWPPRRTATLEIPTDEQETALLTAGIRLRLALETLRSVPMADGEPIKIGLDRGAQTELQSFARGQEAINLELPDTSVMRGCRSKSRGWAARLAGVMVLLRAHEERGVRPDDEPLPEIDFDSLKVCASDMAAAIELTEWQLAENERAYRALRLDDHDLQRDRDYELALEALDEATGEVTSAMLARKHRIGAEQAAAILGRLVAAKLWGERHDKPGEKGGRPTARYFPLGGHAIR
jgi:hypothetical protein